MNFIVHLPRHCCAPPPIGFIAVCLRRRRELWCLICKKTCRCRKKVLWSSFGLGVIFITGLWPNGGQQTATHTPTEEGGPRAHRQALLSKTIDINIAASGKKNTNAASIPATPSLSCSLTPQKRGASGGAGAPASFRPPLLQPGESLVFGSPTVLQVQFKPPTSPSVKAKAVTWSIPPALVEAELVVSGTTAKVCRSSQFPGFWSDGVWPGSHDQASAPFMVFVQKVQVWA